MFTWSRINYVVKHSLLLRQSNHDSIPEQILIFTNNRLDISSQQAFLVLQVVWDINNLDLRHALCSSLYRHRNFFKVYHIIISTVEAHLQWHVIIHAKYVWVCSNQPADDDAVEWMAPAGEDRKAQYPYLSSVTHSRSCNKNRTPLYDTKS